MLHKTDTLYIKFKFGLKVFQCGVVDDFEKSLLSKTLQRLGLDSVSGAHSAPPPLYGLECLGSCALTSDTLSLLRHLPNINFCG